MTLPVPGDVAPGVVPKDTSSLEALIARILGRMSEDQRRTLYSAVISAGGLTVQDDGFITLINSDGLQVLYIGPGPAPDHRHQVIIHRGDGSYVLTSLNSGPGTKVRWALQDRAGHFIVQDDQDADSGLAKPWLDVTLYPLFSMAASTVYGYLNLPVSATERTLWTGQIPHVSHPRLQVAGIFGQASGSNANTFRLREVGGGGAVIGTWSTTTGQLLNDVWVFDVESLYDRVGLPVDLTVQSSGSGNVACQVTSVCLRGTVS